MKVGYSPVKPWEYEGDVLVVGIWQEGEWSADVVELDRRLSGALSRARQRGELSGTWLTPWTTETFGFIRATRIVVLGLGQRERVGVRELRLIAGQAAQEAVKHKARRVGCFLPETPVDAAVAAEVMTDGLLVGAWVFGTYKSTPPEETLEEATLLGFDAQVDSAVQRGAILAECQNFVRDLGMQPSNKLYPETLAKAAVDAATTHGLDVEVFDEKRLEELGMGAILGVGSGSVFPPRLVVLRYQGGGARTLALVGKGITFDSGGISLKSAAGMEEMKFDMLGAAAVLGAMIAIRRLGLPINVVGLMALAQNMPSGSAYKPGDVLKAFNGKTIEVLNTDAEGRVALADAVSYAVHLGADWIVEASTLTGAAITALGHEATALIATDDPLASLVLQASEASGERVWRLPAYPEYRELYRSDVADLKNAPGRDAGTITGGLIISEFAGEVPFAHLDIAGTAWTGKSPLNRTKNGPTGVMVRTFVKLAEMLSR
ncbi:MAG: leucyl aminopeptidase [Firmicutes bacterium]|nr:leucyl aminopeptidase [Bacillota bacterium]